MKNKIFAIYKRLPLVIRSSCKVMQRYISCIKKGHGLQGLKILLQTAGTQSKIFVNEYYQQTENLDDNFEKKFERLQKQTEGLHTLLSVDKQFSYTVLIPLDNPSPKYFREMLESAVQLTAPDLEILVGYNNNESEQVLKVLSEFKQRYPEKIRSIEVSSNIIYTLAANAKGRYLLFMGQEDLVRCDLLFRYEQVLRLADDKKSLVLYCNEYKIGKKNSPPIFNPNPHHGTLSNFPYVFSKIFHRSLLIPKQLWQLTIGLENVANDIKIFDIVLKLDLAGARFLNVPFSFYGYRQDAEKNLSTQSVVQNLLQAYIKQKGLDWTYSQGYTSQTYRAQPSLEIIPKIQVIIPYKNQKELTLKAVKSILNQKGVHTVITAVDNGSDDRTIASEIEDLGGEVLFVDEPFNYSRLNNRALKNSSRGKDCDLVLFMNNDVEIDERAIEEMARWVYQPHIGIVGCRLNYPNGLLQHGGVQLDMRAPAHQKIWEHTEKTLSFSELKYAHILGIVDSVTAACVLMKKDIFLEVGGFDEIWYPIRYSDITLTEKLKARGYLCFYTPYAFGIHYESISRKYDNIEDIESSAWFYDQWSKSFKELSLTETDKNYEESLV